MMTVSNSIGMMNLSYDDAFDKILDVEVRKKELENFLYKFGLKC